jgi:hypothetical protein
MRAQSGYQPSLWGSDTYRAMQTAIAGQLKMRYAPPKELTPTLMDLLAAIDNQPSDPGQ